MILGSRMDKKNPSVRTDGLIEYHLNNEMQLVRLTYSSMAFPL